MLSTHSSLASSKSCSFQFCFCGGLRVAVTVGDRRAVAMDFVDTVAGLLQIHHELGYFYMKFYRLSELSWYKSKLIVWHTYTIINAPVYTQSQLWKSSEAFDD